MYYQLHHSPASTPLYWWVHDNTYYEWEDEGFVGAKKIVISFHCNYRYHRHRNFDKKVSLKLSVDYTIDVV